MTRPAEIRCTGAHPSDPRRECRAKLADVVPGSVSVKANGPTQPGCVRLRCWRCGAEYVVCPVGKAA